MKMLSEVMRGLRSSEFSSIFTRAVKNNVEGESTDLITPVCFAKDMVSAAYTPNRHQSFNTNSHFHLWAARDEAPNITTDYAVNTFRKLVLYTMTDLEIKQYHFW